MNTMEQLRDEIRDLELERNNFLFENDRLRAKLMHVTQEAIHCKRSLEKSKKTIQVLNSQSKYYYDEIQRIENELCTKENEQLNLIQHLKFLREEASKIETNNRCLSEELKSCKQKLSEAEKEIMRLEACIEEKVCDLRSLGESLQELSSLTHQLEEQLESTQIEKYSQKQKLTHCQGTLEELLMQKEALSYQLTTCECCKSKIEEELEQKQTSIEFLENELSKEQQRSSHLEELLRQTKKEVHEVCFSNQRFQEEILGLNDKMEFLCAKVHGKHKENENFYSNIEVLRKQITFARHEKSNAMKEELRQTKRHSVAATGFRDQLHVIFPKKMRNRKPIDKKVKMDLKISIENTKYPVTNGGRCPSLACNSNSQRQEKRQCDNISNGKIKEADLRYSLYLENLSKMNSYAQNKKNQKKNLHCKQSGLRNNKRSCSSNETNFKSGDVAPVLIRKRDPSNFKCKILGTQYQSAEHETVFKNLLSHDIKQNILENLKTELNKTTIRSYQDGENSSSAHVIQNCKSNEFYDKSIKNQLQDKLDLKHMVRTNKTETIKNSNSKIDGNRTRNEPHNPDKNLIGSSNYTTAIVHRVFTDTYNERQFNLLENKCKNEVSHPEDCKNAKQIEKITNDGHRKLQKKLKFWKNLENVKAKHTTHPPSDFVIIDSK